MPDPKKNIDDILKKLASRRQASEVEDERSQSVVYKDNTQTVKAEIPKKKEIKYEPVVNKLQAPAEIMMDYLDGNITEYVVNPVKKAVSKILPDSFKYTPELSTTTSKYDNTEGEKQYLLDNKNYNDIKNEKNLSFAQISESKYSNLILPEALKKRNVNSIRAQGYDFDTEAWLNRFMSDESKTGGQLDRVPSRLGDQREDIFLMYAGLPQLHDTFTISKYKAGSDSDTNITFKDPKVLRRYVFEAAGKTDLFKKLVAGEITPETIEAENASGKRGGEKSHKALFKDDQNVMWNAQFGIGFDEKGKPYLSFYDNWDLKLKDDYLVSKDTGGGAIEIYDRIPLSEPLIKALAKLQVQKDTDEASSDSEARKAESITDDAEIEKLIKESMEGAKEKNKKQDQGRNNENLASEIRDLLSNI